MFWKISHVRSRAPRSSRGLGIELLENRVVPSGTPGIADVAATSAEWIASPAVCAATAEYAATPEEHVADVVVQLLGSLLDAEGNAGQLTSEVVGAANPWLVDSVAIEDDGGLLLDSAADALVEAALTVDASDTAQQSGEDSLMVKTPPANAPPVISDFIAINELGDLWTFQGTVTDVNDPVQGMVVHFGGVLASFNVTATVEANGTFSLTREFSGLQSGTATAQTQDPHGALSNEAWYVITVL